MGKGIESSRDVRIFIEGLCLEGKALFSPPSFTRCASMIHKLLTGFRRAAIQVFTMT